MLKHLINKSSVYIKVSNTSIMSENQVNLFFFIRILSLSTHGCLEVEMVDTHFTREDISLVYEGSSAHLKEVMTLGSLLQGHTIAIVL